MAEEQRIQSQAFEFSAERKSQLAFLFYFIASGILTWIFIMAAPFYPSLEQMILSCSIAGAKWLLQIIAAAIFLREIRWKFLERIGATCFIGSILLLPYALLSLAFGFDSPGFFVSSLLVAVLTMILFYYKSVVNSGLELKWWYSWILSLIVAISLQLTVVFDVI